MEVTLPTSWKKCEELEFPRALYSKDVPEVCDVIVVYTAYFKNSTRGGGLHIWAHSLADSQEYWYMVPYSKNPCYEAARELQHGDRVAIRTYRTKKGRQFVKEIVEL